ncbi:MAG: flagellar filament capping protein FliD [Synergistaceae bacterium]|nr:flagellar filament capping protein FliD [Synergistaceae bacterium]
MASMSISGVVSGMDWDSMIDSIIESAAEPAQVQVNKKTNLTRKKSLFEEMKVMVQGIQNSMTSLKLPSTYNAKEIEIERLDSNASYKGVLTATVNADAEVSVHELEVQQIARAQTNRSSQITSSTLGGAGVTDSTLYISAAGQKIGVDVYSTDTLQSLKSRINNTLKTLDTPINVTAYVSDNKLLLRSDYTGTGETSVEETISYSLNGYNKLSDILVDEGNESSLSISGYTQGTDYVVVNTPEGSEIRWNLYEDTDEVKLGDSISATYTFGAGDVFDSSVMDISATKGSSTESTKSVSSLLGFTPKYYENLKIKDSNGAIYTYGKDFTINDSGAVEWLQSETISKKPSGTYTVNYPGAVLKSTNTVTVGTNTSGTIVRDVNMTSNGFYTYAELNEKYNELYGTDIPTVDFTHSNGTTYTYLNPSEGFNIDGYEYGKDYVLRKGGNDILITWSGHSIATLYANNQGIDISDAKYAAIGDTYNLEFVADLTATGDESTDISTLLGTSVDSSDYANLVITDEDGTNYTYGEDFTINSSGVIEWLGTVSYPDAVNPADGTEYSFIYTSAKPITASVTSSQLISGDSYFLYLNADDQANPRGLSYSQFLSDIGGTLTADSVKQNLTVSSTDSSGNTTTYTYGTDFMIDNRGAGYPSIRWLSSNHPESFDVTFTGHTSGVDSGGETLKFDVERSYTDDILSSSSDDIPYYSKFSGGTTTITQGGKTYYEGVDFEVVELDDNDDTTTNRAQIQWLTDTGYEWYLPQSGQNSRYTINLTDSDGTTHSYSGIRDYQDTLDMRDYGFTSVNGAITSVTYQGSSTHTYDLTSTTTDSDGDTPSQNMQDEIGTRYSEGTNGGVKVFNFDWVTPERTANSLPESNAQLTVSYGYDANTFELSDSNDNSLLKALGFLNSSGEYDDDNYTAAQNAKIVLDGTNTIERSSNYIGSSYENEIDELKGVTLTLKGVGTVSLDIAHDAEKAVESIQTFVDGYNDLMTWMNTRMTESQVDEDTAATVDSDDFRMRWGLLHGNALLRQTKSQMRNIVAQNFTFSFTQRVSSEEIYGTMAHNGLKADSTLRLRIGTKYVDVPVYTTDTISDIAARINDPDNYAMRAIFYDDDGNLLEQPLIKANVENDVLAINSTSEDEITMSGTAAMNALKMNYTYKGIYQLGISTTSTDYGKSGELEFDTSKFMEALEDNPTETQNLMMKFAAEMDTWLKSMLTTSASGETKGTLTRQIDDIQTQIDSINEYLENYQERLDRMEESLRSKYAAAEDRIAQLSQKASSIAAILNQLNGTSSSSSSSSSSS